MSGSGNRSVNGGGSGNRQRNLSMASNTSSSSFKDNGANNRRSAESHHVTSTRSRNGAVNSSQSANVNDSYLRDGRPVVNGSFSMGQRRDFQHLRSEYGATSSNGLLDNPCDSEQEIQEKLNELQQKKWQYENVMSQIQQLQATLSGPQSPHVHSSSVPTARRERPTELGSLEVGYVPVNHQRSTKLQEAQQRLSGSLIQLQDLMQNVSLDLDCNPIFSRHNKDKNLNPNPTVIKECPHFLRNVPSNDSSIAKPAASHLRMNARHYNTVGLPRVTPSHHHCSPQQNNLSSDSLTPKSHQPTHQVNGFLMDMFARSEEHSLNSSNEESAGDIDENLLDGDEDDDNLQDRHSHDDQVPHGETTSARYNIQSRMDSLEQQMERANSLCEMLLVEQRRLSLMMDNLLTSITQLQCNPATRTGRNPPIHHLIPLSSLPLNSSWQGDVGSSSDTQQLAQAVNQCCQLLTQLQRDMSSIQQSSDTSPQSLNAETTLRTPDTQQNPFRNSKPRSSQPSLSTYDLDRFDPSGMTLNNRVPPTPRTNNYWDNFRSYSRQNLLSTATSSSKMSTTSTRVPLVQVPHLLPPASTTSAPTSISSHREQRPPVTRKTKRKVNKGQRQMTIGVHSPHADNRALAGTYGMNSGPTIGDNSAFIGRNLNPESGHADVSVQSSSTGNDTSTNKVLKDTSNLKYSGARPKENRRPIESSVIVVAQDANVNLMTSGESAESNAVNGSSIGQQPALESIIRSTLNEHAARPQFLAHLLQLLHKFDNDSLRQMALNALQGVADVSRGQSELLKVFEAVVANQREFTPALLETFLSTVQHQQQQSEEDHDILVEGASALPHPQSEDQYIFFIRHALTPFLFRRLSQVHELIGDTLIKLESGSLTPQNDNTIGAGASSTTTAQEDDLAEADQSCDGAIVDGILDSSPVATSVPDWNEVDVVTSSSISNRHSVVASGLDEVPTRLMSILNPPQWPRTAQHSSSPTPEDSVQNVRPSSNSNSVRQRNEPECSSSAWFPEDDSM